MISLSLDISQAVVPTLQHCSWLMPHGGRLAVAMRKGTLLLRSLSTFCSYWALCGVRKIVLGFCKKQSLTLSSSIFSGLYLFALWRALCIRNKGAPPDIRQRGRRRLAADFELFGWRGVGEGRHLPPTRLFGGSRCGAARGAAIFTVRGEAG